jgi:hypothetical protein
MIDLHPAPVPELSEEWIASHQSALIDAVSQPHRSALRWVALSGGTVAATASALVLTLVVGGGSTPDAFAGWSPSPTAPAANQLSSADATCQTTLAQLAPTNKGSGGASLVPELSDVRGPFTATVFANSAQDEALCLSAPNATSLRWIGGSGVPVGSGAIAVDQVSYKSLAGQPYTLVVGRIGTGVTGVTLSLQNGDSVTASSGNGLFIAWWPGSHGVTSAAVATAAGSSTQTLNLAGPGAPPATKSAPLPPAGSEDSSSGSTACGVDCP